MKTFHYITKDGEGWIKAVNPFEQYPDLESTNSSEEYLAFILANPPIKWVGDKLQEGTVLREEELDFPWQFYDINYQKWQDIPDEIYEYFNKDVDVKFRKTARLKTTLEQDKIPVCSTCNKYTIRENSDNITVCNGCEMPVKNCNCQAARLKLNSQREEYPHREQGEAEQPVSRNDETEYTYYEIEFVNCGLDFDYTIVETLEDVVPYLRMVDHVLDDPDWDRDLQKPHVEVKGIGMTQKAYKEWCKDAGISPSPVSSQPVTEPVKEEELAQLFDNKFDGYIQTSEGLDIHAMSKQRFIEVYKALTPLQPNEKGEEHYEELADIAEACFWLHDTFSLDREEFIRRVKSQGFKIVKEKR